VGKGGCKDSQPVSQKWVSQSMSHLPHALQLALNTSHRTGKRTNWNWRWRWWWIWRWRWKCRWRIRRLRTEAVGSWFDFYACCFMPHCSQPPSPNLPSFYPPVTLLKSAFLSKTGNCAKEPEVVCCPCRRLLQLVCTPTTLTPFYLHIKQRRWPVTWDSDTERQRRRRRQRWQCAPRDAHASIRI